MIKHTFKTTIAAAMLICAGSAQAAIMDIAENGDFEAGLTGWTTFDTIGAGTGSESIVSGNPGNGLNLSVAGATGGGTDQIIKNANKTGGGTVTPGAPITVTWDMKGTITQPGAVIFVELFSELSGGGTSLAELYTGGPLTPNASWTSYSWTTTLGGDVSGGVTLQLKAGCGPFTACAVSVDFDNITMTTDVTPVPVPAAVWLFGSGLLGLIGVARRKKAA